MAGMTCAYGAKLDDHEAPNDAELRIHTDKEWEDIFNGESIQSWMIPLPECNVWRCPVYKRIYVYEKDNDSPVMIYCLEEGWYTLPGFAGQYPYLGGTIS